MRSATLAWVASAELLHVCASATGVTANAHCTNAGAPFDTTNTLTNNAPVVIWSVGANAATGGISTDEFQNTLATAGNPGSPDRIFVSRTRSANPEFDDIVTWVSAGRLIHRMIVAGQLP
jgi:hypothetical protein